MSVTRRKAGVFTVVVLLAALLSTVPSATVVDATSGSGHNPYAVPLAVDDAPAPNVFETTIVAELKNNVEIGPNGRTANVMTFNGTIPGPEIRVNVGDTVIVHFENHMSFPTGIHWHGIEDDNASDGTPLTQNLVQPDHKFLYKFTVPRAGVFWYHPHHHSSTNQVFKGMYGPLIVTDPAEATLQSNGTLPTQASTHTLVLSDITVCKDPGANDALTYPYDPGDSPPWAGGGDLPAQQAPHPTDLCDTPIDEDGNPIENPPGTPTPLHKGDVPNIQRLSGPSNEGQTVLTNGMNVGGRGGSPSAPGNLDAGAKTLPVTPGTGVRFQVINAAPIRYMRLRLTDSAGNQIKLFRVGGEGGLLDKTELDGGVVNGFDFRYASGEVLLGPGDRADVVAAIPADATGVATLWTLDYERQGTGGNGNQKFTNIPTVPVAHLEITGAAAANPYSISVGTPLLNAVGRSIDVLPAATVTLLDPSSFSPPKPGMTNPEIQLTATGSGSATGINGVQGAHDVTGDYTEADRPDSARFVAGVGDVLELTVNNTTAAHHPFHPHGFSIQPLTLEKPAGTVIYTFPHEFVDTVDVPDKTVLRYRVKLDARPLIDGVTPGGALGRWVFHCHIFFHAVFGMISEITVSDGSGNERPYVNADNVETPLLNKGDTATMTGTFTDPDGDDVTLSASKGSVTPGQNGTWSWSYTIGNAPNQSGLVYITATDAGGKKDQAAFELRVKNNAPTLVAVADKASSEGGVVALAASFNDLDAGDSHSATVDWGDGSGPQPATITEGAPGTIASTHQFGDNGTYHVAISVTDGEASDSEGFDVNVGNVAPDATLDTGGTTVIGGVPTLFTHVNASTPFSGTVTDPGSDDIVSTWDWGDGPPVPDESQISLVNPPNADPPNSPSVQPRTVTHQTVHVFSKTCPQTVAFAASDDDGGTDSQAEKVIATGPAGTKARDSGRWSIDYAPFGPSQYTAAQRSCFLEVAGVVSAVFNEKRDASTAPKAHDVLSAGSLSATRSKLDRELLAAWLNFGGGAFEYSGLLDMNHDRVPDTSFASVMATAEAVRNNPSATNEQLTAQYLRVKSLNEKDELCILNVCVSIT